MTHLINHRLINRLLANFYQHLQQAELKLLQNFLKSFHHFQQHHQEDKSTKAQTWYIMGLTYMPERNKTEVLQTKKKW